MVEVVYLNSPQLQFSVGAECLRQVPPSNSYCRVSVGDEVEVYSTSCGGEPFGWWLAKIRMVVGEWFLVEYMAGGLEFVLQDGIRSRNRNRRGDVDALVRSYVMMDQQKLSAQEAEQRNTAADEEFTGESWESEAVHPDFHLPLAPPPPKAKKPARRRRKGKRQPIQYTMDDEYDAEEVRKTPYGNYLYRLFDGLWVKM